MGIQRQVAAAERQACGGASTRTLRNPSWAAMLAGIGAPSSGTRDPARPRWRRRSPTPRLDDSDGACTRRARGHGIAKGKSDLPPRWQCADRDDRARHGPCRRADERKKKRRTRSPRQRADSGRDIVAVAIVEMTAAAEQVTGTGRPSQQPDDVRIRSSPSRTEAAATGEAIAAGVDDAELVEVGQAFSKRCVASDSSCSSAPARRWRASAPAMFSAARDPTARSSRPRRTPQITLSSTRQQQRLSPRAVRRRLRHRRNSPAET